MSQKPDRRPSAALIVSALALVVALGGTAYAAVQLPKNSVGAAQIKKNAVRSGEVKNGSLKARDLKKGAADPAVTVLAVNQALVPITADVNAPNRTVVRTLDLAAGSYYVEAAVFVENLSGAQIGEPRCFLRSTGATLAGGTMGFYALLRPDTGSDVYRDQFQLDAAFRLPAAGTVLVECTKQSGAQSVSAAASMSAIRVGAVAAP
ncbi:hypothetical protein [Nocardioides sp.]|uniref:hypothetical protein n=1 Tax=Nocardioides sp. TaxID=35761 RepID=UPI001A2BA5F1|nr:hypothetical protein [Nocardioides sp.]MBJ7356223.1 hypothetical protein [Nocardioides sp.]